MRLRESVYREGPENWQHINCSSLQDDNTPGPRPLIAVKQFVKEKNLLLELSDS
jgi:hypothetical protein